MQLLAWPTSDITLATGLLGVLLAAVIYFDLRFMRLPNVLSLAFVLVFAATVAWTLPMEELLWRLGIGLAVLVVGIAANALRLLGGGDVKVLAALVLFFPRAELLSFTYIFCISMIVGIVLLLAIRRALRRYDPAWRGLREGGKYPMGISIGLAGLISIFMG